MRELDRSVPPAVLLAVAGALVSAISMWFPWYQLDPDALLQALGRFTQRSGASAVVGSDFVAQQRPAMVALADRTQWHFIGHLVFGGRNVAVHLGACAVVLLVGLAAATGRISRSLQLVLFAGGALILAARPIIALLKEPGEAYVVARFVHPAGMTARDVAPASYGVWVALLGAALVLIAAVVAARAADEPAPDERQRDIVRPFAEPA
jgi:hypothetical protein